MADRPRVVVLASYMRDVSIAVDRFPLPGETRLGGGSLESHGGKGSNQAVQAARCGADVALIAAVGSDAAGQAARVLWAAEGIDASMAVSRAGQATGLAVIVVDGQGQNQIVIAPGANATLGPADIAAARALITSAQLVLAQLETPQDATLRAFEIASAAGVQTLLNTAPAAATLPAALWAVTDLLVANEIEAALLAGQPVDTEVRTLGGLLLLKVRRAVVITVGAQGAWLFQPGQAACHCPALPVAVQDSTGAGDAFVGAFSACWAAQWAPQAALAEGVAAGSLACRQRGVVPALADGSAITQALLAARPGSA